MFVLGLADAMRRVAFNDTGFDGVGKDAAEKTHGARGRPRAAQLWADQHKRAEARKFLAPRRHDGPAPELPSPRGRALALPKHSI